MTDLIHVGAIVPISRTEAATLSAAEYTRLAEQLDSLDADDWVKPTDCPGWDVRAMAGHCVGMMSDFASLPRLMSHYRAAAKRAKRTGEKMIDAVTAMQVEGHAELSTDELVALVVRRGQEASRSARVPRPVRALPMKEEVGGQPETWRVGYLLDIILTRDPWMHRVDISRATGRDLVLTAGHDGRIVSDVVAEWARRHGQPFVLTLTGPAGGCFTGDGPNADSDRPADVSHDPITLDAVEFCRAVGGRSDRQHLFDQEVPF